MINATWPKRKKIPGKKGGARAAHMAQTKRTREGQRYLAAVSLRKKVTKRP